MSFKITAHNEADDTFTLRSASGHENNHYGWAIELKGKETKADMVGRIVYSDDMRLEKPANYQP